MECGFYTKMKVVRLYFRQVYCSWTLYAVFDLELYTVIFHNCTRQLAAMNKNPLFAFVVIDKTEPFNLVVISDDAGSFCRLLSFFLFRNTDLNVFVAEYPLLSWVRWS